MTEKAKEFYDDLRSQGYTDHQIKSAMCDGAYLSMIYLTQSEAEEIFNFIIKKESE